MGKKNIDIRQAIKNAEVPHWLVAERIGISDTTFSRWLRVELSEEKKIQIFKVLESLKKEVAVNGL